MSSLVVLRSIMPGEEVPGSTAGRDAGLGAGAADGVEEPLVEAAAEEAARVLAGAACGRRVAKYRAAGHVAASDGVYVHPHHMGASEQRSADGQHGLHAYDTRMF
ncbi:hypothetical protein TSOC_002366 [Tetrabaena socialis]|uniref:Uncharacterized protein n=1 Tax=Tetrabaena socialis TaxID=47790 RepID=A0A2J8AEB2_9CHLO|nr:hypothetical protein TSOC_002366 [Tetrabaena socialis]|eukprot:PNH10836.1 hypothetical protein TSOC_002366 [Tetrabaena socialis]